MEIEKSKNPSEALDQLICLAILIRRKKRDRRKRAKMPSQVVKPLVILKTTMRRRRRF